MTKPMTMVAVLALGAGLALAACGSDDDDSGGAYGGGGEPARTEETAQSGQAAKRPPALPTIVLRDGRPLGGVRELSFEAGGQVRFRVRSNGADEVHVHGYDVDKAVPAGGTATFAFPADIEGIFEVESHESGEQLAELRIEP